MARHRAVRALIPNLDALNIYQDGTSGSSPTDSIPRDQERNADRNDNDDVVALNDNEIARIKPLQN